MNRLLRRAGVLLLPATVAVLAACSGSDQGAAGQPTIDARWTAYERPVEYPGSVTLPAEPITMRDGVRLATAVRLPAGEDGEPAAGPFPVLVTLTGYNRGIPAIPAFNNYLVERGYAHVSVDVRGTGSSEGAWEAFSETEQADYYEVLDWAASQPWSNGRIGTWGASFMSITQLPAAAQQYPAHEATFAIVPMGDGYRDIVFSGGQTNIGFIPLWMGPVTALSVVPSVDTLQNPGLYISSALQNLTAKRTAGILGIVAPRCAADNRLNEIVEITYTTPPTRGPPPARSHRPGRLPARSAAGGGSHRSAARRHQHPCRSGQAVERGAAGGARRRGGARALRPASRCHGFPGLPRSAAPDSLAPSHTSREQRMNWYLAVLKDYAKFDGRAGRTEYWMFFLFNLIIGIVLAVIDGALGTIGMMGGMGLLGTIYALAILLPGIGVTMRRLHDTGRVGWWILIAFVPLIGSIWLLILMVLEGNSGDNAYGPPPRRTPEG